MRHSNQSSTKCIHLDLCLFQIILLRVLKYKFVYFFNVFLLLFISTCNFYTGKQINIAIEISSFQKLYFVIQYIRGLYDENFSCRQMFPIPHCFGRVRFSIYLIFTHKEQRTVKMILILKSFSLLETVVQKRLSSTNRRLRLLGSC